MIMISVIIPVYNVENYLNKCIDSVIQQKDSDFEVILVDDGSTDSSGNICDEYSNHSNNVKVIHKKNGGLSDARNVGIQNAKGNYIAFLDSDDYWSDLYLLKKITDVIEKNNPDLIVLGYKKVFPDGHAVEYVPNKMCTNIIELNYRNEFDICAWDKVIKKNILDENQITFKKNVYSEDMEWCAQLLKCANSCAVLSETPYMYRQRSESISKNITKKNVEDLYNNYIDCLKIQTGVSPNKKQAYQIYLSKNFSMFLIVLSMVDRHVWKNYEEFIKENQSILTKNSRIREKIIYLSLQFFGVIQTEKSLRKVITKKQIK